MGNARCWRPERQAGIGQVGGFLCHVGAISVDMVYDKLVFLVRKECVRICLYTFREVNPHEVADGPYLLRVESISEYLEEFSYW